MITIELKDVYGNLIKLGDLIAYGVNTKYGDALRIGRLVEIRSKITNGMVTTKVVISTSKLYASRSPRPIKSVVDPKLHHFLLVSEQTYSNRR